MNKIENTGFRAVFRREVRHIFNTPFYLLVVIVLPIVAMSFFIAMFHTDVPRDLPVAVYDADNSTLSRKLLRMVDATPSVEIRYDVTDKVSGEKLIIEGKAYALICIPKDFEKDIFKNKSPQVLNYYNNIYMIAGGVISKDVATAVNTMSVGVNLNVRTKKGQNTAQALASVLPVRLDTHILYNPFTNYMYYLSTCFLPLMLQIFLLLITVYVFTIERDKNTSQQWYKVSGENYVKAVFGKLAPYTLLFLLLDVAMNYVLFVENNISFKGNVAVFILINILFILSYQALGLIISSIFSGGISMAAGIGAMAFSFSGLTFHYDAMPTISIVVSRMLPFSYYFKGFIDQSMKGMPLENALVPVAGMISFLLIALMLSGKLIEKIFLTNNNTDE